MQSFLRLKALGRQALRSPVRGELGLYAAHGAFYLLLSLGPFTALLLALLPYTAVTERALLGALSAVVPPALTELIAGAARDIYARPSAALGLSLAAELWSAARLLASVVRSVASLSGARAAGYLRGRLLGAGYTLLLIVFILANLMLLLFGERLADAAARSAPALGGLCRLLLAMRPLLLLAGLTALNILLYRSPPGPQRALPGALLAAAAWLAFTRLYSLLLGRFGLFGVYGSIAAVLVTLYWAYWSLYILYLGAWLNRLIDEERGGTCSPARGQPAD